MAILNHLQDNFTAGEWSPLVYGRVRLEKYPNALKTLRDAIATKYGPVIAREGSIYSAEVKTSATATRLIPFIFNTLDAYPIEMGNLYFRFFRNSGQIVAADTDGVVANGGFDTDLASWTDDDQGTGVSAWNAGGYMELDGGGSGNQAQRNQAITIGAGFTAALHVLRFRVQAVGATLNLGTTAGGGEIKADTAYGVGWHSVEFTPGATTFYIEFSSIALNATVDDVSLIDNAAVEIGSPYATADLFEIQLAQSADTIWIVHNNYKPHKLTRSGHSSWSLTEYAPTADPFTTAALYPGTVGFWQQRLWFGRNTTFPRRRYSTMSGDFDDMTTGSDPADALILDPASGEQNRVEWFSPARVLLVGTAGDEDQIRGGSVGEAITPTNENVIPETNIGSDPIQPIRAHNRTLFMNAAGRSLYGLVFSFEVDGYVAVEESELAEHLFPKGTSIVQMAYEKKPYSIIWLVRSDGKLIGLTYERPQEVVAWHLHQTGASGLFESVCSIPHPDGDRHQTWVIVKRTIDGSAVRYVEYFDDSVYTDSALKYSGSSTSTLSGLDHLEGETVAVRGDGANQTNKTVASGAITLDAAVTEAEVGINFQPKIEILEPEILFKSGTSLGQQKAWHEVFLRVKDTAVQPITVNGDILQGLNPDDIMGTAPAVQTGDIKVNVPSAWSENLALEIIRTLPGPMTILAIHGKIQVND